MGYPVVVLALCMVLRLCYALSGTDIVRQYRAKSNAKSGCGCTGTVERDVEIGLLPIFLYAVSGTHIAYPILPRAPYAMS
eukprot:1285805-Rhodomonas_salina.1